VVDGVPAYVTTYVEAPDQDRRWVVVELCSVGKPVLRVFRMRQCFLDGFEVNPSGESRSLGDHEMWKYS